MQIDIKDMSGLKKRIHNGDKLIGVFIPIWFKPDKIAAILASDNYDYVWTDGQHAAFNEETLYAFCNTVGDKGLPTLFRIKHARDAYLIGNTMDIGPSGVEVPQVETEEAVEESVRSFYYPPYGRRSWGGSQRVKLSERPAIKDYQPWWNGYGVLWIQFESIEAVTIAQKLARPGVDCFSFGPADLSINLQMHPNHPFKTLDDCVAYTVEQVKGTEVKVMYRSYKVELRQKYFDMGVTVLLEQPHV